MWNLLGLTIFIGYVIVCENCYFKPHFDKFRR